MNKKIGVYCGSFSPLHCGHIGIIREVLKEGAADLVLVVPTMDYWDKKIAIDFNTRLKCLKTIESDNIIIDSDENDCKAPNTFTLFENLKNKYPGSELKLILGADNLPLFDKWVNYRYLLENYDFVIMNRTGYDALKELKRLGKTSFRILDCEQFDVSSTFIREHLEDDEALKGLLPDSVIEVLKNK